MHYRTGQRGAAVVLVSVLLAACGGVTDPGSAPGSGGGGEATPTPTVVAWADTAGNGLWRGAADLSQSANLWTASVALSDTGSTLFHAYVVDAGGTLESVGRVTETVSSSPAEVSFGDTELTDVTLLAGSVQDRELNLNHYVNAIAGAGLQAGHADGTFQDGTRLDAPQAITTDGRYLYVADTGNHVIRRMSIRTGELSTLAGSPGNDGSADSSDGTGATARFASPAGITVDGEYLYVSEGSPSGRIRRVHVETGATTTIMTGLSSPRGLIVFEDMLYVVDWDATLLWRIDPVAQTFASVVGANVTNRAYADGTGTDARLYGPQDITTDGTMFYITDMDAETIREVNPDTWEVTTFAGVNNNSDVTDGTGDEARFSRPKGITTDGTHLYVADGNVVIRKIDIDTAAVTTIAGDASGDPGSTWGVGSSALFGVPAGITTDGINLYITEEGNHLIRKMQ